MGNLLRPWNKHLLGKDLVLGYQITYFDFLLYEELDWSTELNAGAFRCFPVLMAYIKRYEELPEMQQYFVSDK